jgi:hypothetical protein
MHDEVHDMDEMMSLIAIKPCGDTPSAPDCGILLAFTDRSLRAASRRHGQHSHLHRNP